MSDLNVAAFSQPTQYTNYGFSNPINLYDFANYAAVTDFESTLQQSIPLTSGYKLEALDLYKERGAVNGEEASPTATMDEAIKSVLSFAELMVKQIGLLTQAINQRTQSTAALTQLITAGINALMGVATGGFSFNAFSIIGALVSAAGFSGIGNLIASLGGAMDNMKAAREQEEKVSKEIGKKVTAGVQATQQVMEIAEGNNVSMANLNQTNANVINFEANVSYNERAPMKSSAIDTLVETSTDHVVTSNFYQANHTYHSVQIDHAYNFSTRHSTRYHSASVVEIAAQADYISSSLMSYADFRWTQTGQGVASLPIANPLESLVGQLFKTSAVPVTGVNIDISTFAKLTSSQFFNLNYGLFYAIDGFVMINCGVASGLASIPPRLINSISDIQPPPTTDRQDPESFVSVNNKTYETIYKNNEKFEGINFGQLFTKAEAASKTLQEQNPPGRTVNELNDLG